MAASIPSLPPDQIQKLLAGPALPPPAGYGSDFTSPNPYSKSINGMIAVGVFGAIAFSSMRLYTQHVVSGGLVAEDYFLIGAVAAQIGCSVVSPIIVHAGVGKHMWDMTMLQFFKAAKFTWLFVIFYYLAIGLIKTAILLQLTRVFRADRLTRRACWACIAINTVVYAPAFFLNIFECTPVSAAWNRAQPSHCISVSFLYNFTGIFNAISDFTMVAIPVPVLLKLRISAKRKALIMAVFATGIIACVASVLRAYFTFLAFGSHDLSFYLIWMGTCCTFEIVFGIITFFMPVVAVLYNHVRQKINPASRPFNPAWERRSGRHAEPRVPSKQASTATAYELPASSSSSEDIEAEPPPPPMGIERQITTTVVIEETEVGQRF